MNKMEKILAIMDAIVKGDGMIAQLIREKPFCIVHKSAPITYMGKKGRLVWDYLVWNEITFEDVENNVKYSLCNKWDDKETETIFDEFVSKYGN